MSKPGDNVNRRGSLLVSHFSTQKRSYSDDDLYEDDSEESGEAMPDLATVPSKLPRVVPSVSLSSDSVTTPRAQLSYQFDSASAIQSVVMNSASGDARLLPDNMPPDLFPRGRRGNPLAWRGGRLESILLSDKPFPLSQSRYYRRHKLPIPNNDHFPRPALPQPRGRGRPRGRPRATHLGSGSSRVIEDDWQPGTSPHLESRGVSSRFRRGRQDSSATTPLLLEPREHHSPTDMSLPVLDLRATHDPMALLNKESKSGSGDTVSANLQSSSSSTSLSNLTGRMKSSDGLGDIDLQELKSYRRLNGYTLFVLVNKRKYGALTTNDDASMDSTGESARLQKENHRKLQAIWSTLPEKEQKKWRTKARRLVKQSELHSKRAEMSKTKRDADRRRLENQLARNESVSTELTDIAAHFQLLSDTFVMYAKQLDEYGGPVDVLSVESTLLDGLLTCMIALLALFGESNMLPGVPKKEDVCLALKSLTYIMPL